MTREKFRELLRSGIVMLDGATGTNLQDAGMPIGVCPEEWILGNEEAILELQEAYVAAGSNIIYAPTFTGNRIKLGEYGLENRIEEINTKLVELSKRAANNKAYVAGDLTLTGEQLKPSGKMEFEELVTIYKEQVSILIKAGVDLFVVETMMSLQETRAAVLAIKETCDLPIMASLTFEETGRTLYGSTPEATVIVLQALGVDAIGTNCSTGPTQMIPIIKAMKEYAKVPIFAKPNAGMPTLDGEKTIYDMSESEFAEAARELVLAGANMIGGCCGTTPRHMKATKDKILGMKPIQPFEQSKGYLSSETDITQIDVDGRFLIIGERINPTGKKSLQAELREDKFELVLQMAKEQVENGANILDVNMGMNGIDEKETMLKAITNLSTSVNIPLCIDSSYVDVIEAALRIYPGRALLNSISFESEKIEKLLPIAAKYGAMFILLPLSDNGLPKSLEEKKEIINAVLQKAYKFGFTNKDVVVDGLVTTVGANKNAAVETLQTIKYCKEVLGIATVVGLSNISFGLPERTYINSSFLSMAIHDGLTMAIANPSQEILVMSAFASDILKNKKNASIRYINKANNKNDEVETVVNPIFEAVLKGKKNIIELIKDALQNGEKPSEIINEHLIPAINEVGILFDKKTYFLPQLISSAETMKMGIEYLEPMLEITSDTKEKKTVVMATVKGDIHDIGKNLVVLMLKNYGYNVIDLGKDVSTQKIIETAIEHNADIIGLSALMTTTMMEMKQVVNEVKKAKLKAKVIIGGAVITQSFADEIGADGYSSDAADAVKLVKRLI
ncbi:MAG: hypothetical protein K0R15_2568 [Clostridiales bacterium]|jgi:5-methyltetrahydrofolate--homocysteine methyltransferase|nr:hypothetical protein [Clostridiales bacterium]